LEVVIASNILFLFNVLVWQHVCVGRKHCNF